MLDKSFAPIDRQSLVNFGLLRSTFDDPAHYDRIAQGDMLRFDGIREALASERRADMGKATRGW